MHNSAAHKFTSIPSPQQQFTGNYLAVYFPFSARPKEMLRRHQEPAVFIFHQPSQHPAHSYISSTLPISFPKGRGNLGAGICAPAWVPSWLRGHHSPSAPSPSEGTNLCVPPPHGTDKQARKDDGKSSSLWDRSHKAWLGDGWHQGRKEDMECACHILYNTRKTWAAHSSQEHNHIWESGWDLDGVLHNPIFNY